MGRKSKYEEKFCDQLIEDMAEGLSFEACCGNIGVSKDTGYEWVKRYPEFAEAKQIGEARGQYFWERSARDNLLIDSKELKFNSTVFIFTMKNRFGWRERKELSGSVGVGGGLGKLFGALSNEQIEQRIAEILDRLPSKGQE